MAAVRASDEQIDGLGTALDDMIVYRDDPAKHCSTDLDFHLRLARATGNAMFAVMLQPITALIQEGILRGGGLIEARMRGIREHQAVYEGVRRHGPSAAREAMAAHMRTTHGELAAVHAPRTEESATSGSRTHTRTST